MHTRTTDARYSVASLKRRFADRISDLSDERQYGDGYFVALKAGWRDLNDCQIVHEYTLNALASSLSECRLIS